MTVHKLKTEEATFETFWRLFPAERRRRKRLCKAMFEEITTTGRWATTRDAEGLGMTKMWVQDSAEDIIEGTRRWVRSLPIGDDYGLKDPQYVKTSPVFLNQCIYADYLDED